MGAPIERRVEGYEAASQKERQCEVLGIKRLRPPELLREFPRRVTEPRVRRLAHHARGKELTRVIRTHELQLSTPEASWSTDRHSDHSSGGATRSRSGNELARRSTGARASATLASIPATSARPATGAPAPPSSVAASRRMSSPRTQANASDPVRRERGPARRSRRRGAGCRCAQIEGALPGSSAAGFPGSGRCVARPRERLST